MSFGDEQHSSDHEHSNEECGPEPVGHNADLEAREDHDPAATNRDENTRYCNGPEYGHEKDCFKIPRNALGSYKEGLMML